MTEVSAPERALAAIVRELLARGRESAVVGGLAVSVRAEVRFTRDVDVAVVVADDAEAERLVHDLGASGYTPVASVEHALRNRLATIRLVGPASVTVGLLFASSGIEREVVERATTVALPGVGAVRVARSEELLALKLLSMTERRLQDRLDAIRILEVDDRVNLDEVRANLDLITARGYHRSQDLQAKLDQLLRDLQH